MEMLADIFGKKIRFTDERKFHILRKAEMKEQESKIIETIREPDFIRHSISDKSVRLYYKFYPKTPVGDKYLLTAVKLFNGEGFIITAFFTDKIKKGEIIWKKE